MNEPPQRTPGGSRRVRSRRLLMGLCGVSLVAVGFSLLWMSADRDSQGGRPASATNVPRAATFPIVYVGSGTQTTASFYLAGGAYHTLWSAWERAPEYPPCTHSMELLSVEPANATTSSGYVVDLARAVQVPATGGSHERYLDDVDAGDYYLEIYSECSWQIEISPTSGT